MEWVRILAYITGTVDQELLLRNEYLATENRILRAQIKGRLLLADAEKKTLADIEHGLGWHVQSSGEYQAILRRQTAPSGECPPRGVKKLQPIDSLSFTLRAVFS